MFKKITALLLVVLMLVSVAAFTSCGDANASDLKIGVILIGDETEGYSLAHINGIKDAAKALNIKEEQIQWKYKIEETNDVYEEASALVAEGCKLIISNSYGHQDFMAQAAKDFPSVTFVAMTGDYAAISNIPNLYNAFTDVYESRYISGVVAGLKLKALLEDGTLTTSTQPDSFDENGNVKIGYVGAFPYAEVVSGYTAFYLGIKSVVSNVVMDVYYTGYWFHIDNEAAAAEKLIADGCVIIGQHADSTGAPTATQKALNNGKIAYSVGYNVDMLEVAGTAALTSATNTWSVYYKTLIEAFMNNQTIPQNWAEGFSKDAVAITKLGPSCAEGTEAYVNDVIAKIKDGTLHVFDTSKFTVGGETITTYNPSLSYMDFSTDPITVVYEGPVVEAIKTDANGVSYFDESSFRSAPYFDLRIDGITEINP